MLSSEGKAKNLADSPHEMQHKESPPQTHGLTSFPETLNSTNFDEKEMKDVQLYDENSPFEKTADGQPEEQSQNGERGAAEQRGTTMEKMTEQTHFQTETDEEQHKFESLATSINGQFGKTVVIHATDEDPSETFERLKEACINATLPYKDIIDSLFNTIVGGPFDLESRYVIADSENISRMIELLELCPQNVQAEIWSIFVAIIRKSFLNLGAATESGLISKILDLLPNANANSVTTDLLIELLTVLTNYSISVKECKYFLRFLRILDDGFWKPNSTKLFAVMKEMPKRDGPDVFFLFPGNESAGISLPPLLRWPYQNGWTFSTWLRMDPLHSIYFEKERPYLFSFSTSKGLGYFCYFMGNCLVLRCVRAPGKETLHCVKHELLPRKWHHVALSFVYSRWAKSEIHCFVDGYLVEAIDANWLVSTTDHFDRCFVGCGSQPNLNEAFSGQMAAVYVFSQAISPPLVTALLYLGVSYQSQFKHEAESNLPVTYRKQLFDGRLHDSLVFAYCPKNCHDQLCLFQQQTPKMGQLHSSYFVQVPHAVMKNGVKLVKTHSIHCSLHSIGGIQVLLPLFSQIDAKQHEPVDDDICADLLSVVSILLNCSTTAQQQFLHVQGFAIIASTIVSADRRHLTMNLLEGFISIYKLLLNCSIGVPLLKQLIDSVFLTPTLWVRADASVQMHLYDFLVDELFSISLSNNNALLLLAPSSSIIRRTHTVLTLMHTLKQFYWVVRPTTTPTANSIAAQMAMEPMDRLTVVHIRGCILKIVNRLMFNTVPEDVNEKEENRDEEFQCLLNFVNTVQEDDNLYDVLTQLSNQLANHPAIMVPAFDRKKALCVIFKLVASGNELIRIPTLKMLGYYLCRSTQKRKNESINQKNLFHLLTEKLLLNCRSLSLATYNTLFEMLVEQICPEILFIKHEDLPIDSTRFENHQLLKVIAQLLCQSEECAELIRVKCIFLRDVIRLCEGSRDNRRTILQMSVWQEWLISLAYIYPSDEQQKEVTELVYELFSILLFHAMRLEYGGWRVWVDSMAIAHSKVSWEKYRRKVLQKEKRLAERTEFERQAGESVGEQPMALYRTPDFIWSPVHIRLLSDLLESIETVVQEWNDSGTSIADHLNNGDNQVFIANTIHLLSQLGDSLTMACGGLLPLLAAATAPNSELEINDTTQQQLDIEDAARFLAIFAELSDVFVFASGVSLNELEQEKNMPSGGILRQSLRLVSTVTVRNILACSVRKDGLSNANINNNNNNDLPKLVAIRKLCESSKPITDFDRLLQSVDLQRLKGIIYRDMEETKQAQFLALAVVYFLSVLMVSRYRDILEPPQPAAAIPPHKTSFSSRPANSPSNGSASPSMTAQNGALAVADASSNAMEHIDGDDDDHSADSGKISGKNGRDAATETNDDTNAKKAIDGEMDEEEESGTTRGIIGQMGGKKSDDGKSGKRAAAIGDETDNEEEEEGIAAIRCANNATEEVTIENKYGPAHLENFNAPNVRRNSAAAESTGERRQYLTTTLHKALEPVLPLFREILSDFRSFLQKTLLGTHGQEIMNDVKVLQTLKSGSVVEIVMLLCSQEWQTSLQKHAGLAFIELVNEGRLMAHATRDHILRVANEADFILNRLRAEDVSKHAQFESESNEQLLHRKGEEQLAEQLLVASKHREFVLASRTLDKICNVLTHPHGPWSPSPDERKKIFWKLDVWEDDSRRRRRFVQNPWGKRHKLVTSIQKQTAEQQKQQKKETETDREQFLKDLSHKMITAGGQAKGLTVHEFMDEADIEKWLKDESDLSEPIEDLTTYSTVGKLIAPGLVIPGTISLTETDLFFDADEEHPIYRKQNPLSFTTCDNLHARWNFHEIRAIFLRRYLLQYTALELFLASRTAIMFAFPDHDAVKKVVAHLPRVGVGVKYGLPQNRRASLMTPKQLFKHSDMPQKWQQREISNFDYLMFLNTIAGRTYNDLNQYPVFPWVLNNYMSDKLDMGDVSNFRDLSKPIGALSDSRRKHFQERFANWEDTEVPAFHFGTHYSTQAFTLNWLFRLEPFTTLFLDLQDGRFDHSNRLFHSMAETWEHCLNDTHDVKELVPELFYLPEMFINANSYELGTREDGTVVNDVRLPPWCNGSAETFVRMHRQALESDLVSCQLHQWVDLIFGYKQRGPEAVRATNVFYHLTYEGSVDLCAIENGALRESIQQQILNFGQTPAQLLNGPHPPRHSVMTMSPMMYQPYPNDLCMLMKFISNSPIVHIAANTYQQLAEPSVVTITQNLVFSLNRWNPNFVQAQSQSPNNSVLNAASSLTDKTSTMADSSSSSSTTTAGTSQISTAELPITVDPLLAVGNPSQKVPKRHLGDQLDQRLTVSWSNFICTVDSRFIIVCGYPDYSFRLIETANAQVRQVVFGHGNVVTCLARSETSLFADCYVASGSADCTVVLWHFSQHLGLLVGDYNMPGEEPSPRAILTGHDSEISAICVSAEHGIVLSGSTDGALLMHSTQGDLLRSIICSNSNGENTLAPINNILFSRDCYIAAFLGTDSLATFSTNGNPLKQHGYKCVEKILCAILSRDGENVVFGTDNGRISILRLFTLKLLYTFPQCDSPIRSLALSTNQRLIFGGLDSGAIVVFNVDFNRWQNCGDYDGGSFRFTAK